jgi:hypothetical protein
MPGARLPMRKIRDMLRLTAAGMSSRKIAASLSRDDSRGLPAACAGCRCRLAAARGTVRRGAGGTAVSGLNCVGGDQVSAYTGRLAGDPSRTEAAGRNAAAAVGGASRCPPRGLRLQPVLRAVSRLGGAAVANYATESCRWREVVRRLCGYERPMLKPPPAEPYMYAEWKQCRVGVDYHVRSTSTSTRCRTRAHDGARSHAVEPPALRRLDAGADYRPV